METEKYKIGYVRCMLFADFGIEPVRALQFINDMEKRPDKVARYKELVVKSLSLQYEGLKDWSKDKLAELAKQRAKAWRKQMGDIAMPEYLAMSKRWNIPLDRFIDIKLTPEFIKKMLDCYIIGQEDYKIMLSVSFYSYLLQKRSRSILPKSNLLVCGPSGSGKTYGMHILSNLFQVPFVIIHCNSIVQEGIEGSKITDGLTSLLLKGWEKEDIKHAVVCFDEFDKLFEKRKFGIDSGEYNSRIVNEMLNIIDDKGEVEFQTSYERRSDRVKLPTSKMMFVFTGVFDGLRKKDSEKVYRKVMGKITRSISPKTEIDECYKAFREDKAKQSLHSHLMEKVDALYACFKNGENPKNKHIAQLALTYLFNQNDLIHDNLEGVGLVDDVTVIDHALKIIKGCI